MIESEHVNGGRAERKRLKDIESGGGREGERERGREGERERGREGEREGGREGERESQAGSVMSVQSPTQVSIS